MTQRRFETGLGLLTVLLAAGSLLAPEVDLWLMQGVYSAEDGFWLAGTRLEDLYDTGRGYLFPAIGVFILAASVLALIRRPVLRLGRRRLLVIWITLLGVVGLIDNAIFKNGFGRPRPKDVTVFGGEMPFHPPWLPGGACPTNCSFPSGDVGYAFIVVALALAARLGSPRIAAVTIAVAFGLFVAVMRVLTGDHFPSDALFGALLTVLSVLLLNRYFNVDILAGARDDSTHPFQQR